MTEEYNTNEKKYILKKTVFGESLDEVKPMLNHVSEDLATKNCPLEKMSR